MCAVSFGSPLFSVHTVAEIIKKVEKMRENSQNHVNLIIRVTRRTQKGRRKTIFSKPIYKNGFITIVLLSISLEES